MSGALAPSTHVGAVRLQVGDRGRSLSFYRDLLGFAVLDDGNVTRLGPPGAAAPLVELVEHRGARPAAPRSALGLFHFAILLPSRAALGSVLLHLDAHQVPLGASDHRVSEALYLSDPDGLGIEIYRDRPRSEWQWDGDRLAMGTDPLDVQAVVATEGVGPWTAMPTGTTVGHVHLHVHDLEDAEAFYARAVGLDVMVRGYPGALFLSAGGYHHHLGVNTWARGAERPAAGVAQLVHWELVVPDAAEVERVRQRIVAAGARVDTDRDGIVARDPSGTAMRVVSGA